MVHMLHEVRGGAHHVVAPKAQTRVECLGRAHRVTATEHSLFPTSEIGRLDARGLSMYGVVAVEHLMLTTAFAFGGTAVSPLVGVP